MLMRFFVLVVLLLLPIGLVSSWQLLDGWLTRPAWWVLTGEPRPEARARVLAALAEDTEVSRGMLERWQRAGDEALRNPLPISDRYSEQVHVSADAPFVAVYRIDVDAPRTLQIVSTVARGAEGGLVIDVLRGGASDARPLASFGPTLQNRRWPVPTAGTYRLRVQSTIGARGGFGFTFAERRVLDFPVATTATDSVRSLFGVDRDGGARQHHGIDIFAARGTSILAAADGLITRVGTSPRGGLHIWHSALDAGGESIGSLYYAHLETVNVSPGTRVSRGEVIGAVGNSGNAISTPPHLHFGWYRRFYGPTDPLPMVGNSQAPSPSSLAGHGLPRWLAVAGTVLNRRAGPGTGFEITGTQRAGELVQVAGTSGAWARLIDADGSTSFVASELLAPPEARVTTLSADGDLLTEPVSGAPQIVSLLVGEQVAVLGTWGGYRLLRSAVGRLGWMLDEPADDEPVATPGQE